MNGSCATIFMPKARARCATAWPMRPKPTTPSVLSRSSAPIRLFFSQRCCFIAASAVATERASASISAIACSATLMLLPPGALVTTMPRALAASRSTLSTPEPARATILSAGAASMTSLVTLVALRTSRASASAMSLRRSAFGRPAFASTVKPFDFAKERDGRRRQVIGR